MRVLLLQRRQSHNILRMLVRGDWALRWLQGAVAWSGAGVLGVWVRSRHCQTGVHRQAAAGAATWLAGGVAQGAGQISAGLQQPRVHAHRRRPTQVFD